MEHPVYDMLILGGGPAGYTAALYAARAGLRALVLEKLSSGGQMALSQQIDNYPGFEDGIDGFVLGEKMRRQAERFGAVTEYAEAAEADLRADPKVVRASSGTFLGRTVMIATGAVPRTLGLPGEEALIGRGVAYCAACDAMAYRGKTVAVVGGGNAAAADALLLSRIAKKVILVHRRDTLRAEASYLPQLRQAGNVEFCWNSQVAALLHGERLTGLLLRDVSDGTQRELPCDGVFICVGRKPATGFLNGQLPLDSSGYVLAGEDTRTHIPGVYAAGDVRAKPVRQIVTATADGAAAVHAAEEYLR